MARHVYKEVEGKDGALNEVVYISVSNNAKPSGWVNKPAKLLASKSKGREDGYPDGYEIREQGKSSARRNPEKGRIR